VLTPTPPSAAGVFEGILEDTAGNNRFGRAGCAVMTAVGAAYGRGALELPAGVPLPAGLGVQHLASSTNQATATFDGCVFYTQL
jgi:hypothetical protein